MTNDTLSDNDVLRLLEIARDTRPRAHAPYSKYQVGAAVLGDDGHIYGGCNVENASYGLSLCAERVAIHTAVAAGCKSVLSIAVITADAGSPCGACRQVMVEFNPAMIVIIGSLHEDSCRITTAAELLPDHFALNP